MRIIETRFKAILFPIKKINKNVDHSSMFLLRPSFSLTYIVYILEGLGTKFIEFYEPPHEKAKSAYSFAVTAKLICAFVFATRIVQFLFYLNPKFQVSSSFSVTVQVGLYRTWSETTLLVFPRGGSYTNVTELVSSK